MGLRRDHGAGNVVRQTAYVPRRGDVVWITLNPHAGHERGGRRPAVVLSLESYNARVGLALFCPLTNVIKGYPWEVLIPAGLPVSGAVLSDQARSLDWRSRRVEPICALPDAQVAEILGKLGALLAA
jgi:mRNA interferase MazF